MRMLLSIELKSTEAGCSKVEYSAFPGLKFNLLLLVCLFLHVYLFPNFGNKNILLIQTRFLEKIPCLKTSCWEDCFEEFVNLGLS